MELLLSLSIWILMTLSLLPLYAHVNKQAMSIQKEVEATHLMYEVLHVYLMDGIYENKEVARENAPYTIVWQQNHESNPTKVCIGYEDAFNQTRQKCEQIE